MITKVSTGSSDEPKVPDWVVDLLERTFPLQDVLKVDTEADLQKFKGKREVIEFLRVRSENPNR